MTARRQATLRLTEVEEQELERLRRQLHDGPIQLLAALNWRLSVVGGSPAVETVRERIDAVTSELRQVLTEFAPDDDLSAGARLERWIAPFVAGTPLAMTVEEVRLIKDGSFSF